MSGRKFCSAQAEPFGDWYAYHDQPSGPICMLLEGHPLPHRAWEDQNQTMVQWGWPGRKYFELQQADMDAVRKGAQS